MYILGVHVGHESSAALLRHGAVIGAAQEERFTRIKNYSGYPNESIKFLLAEAGIGQKDISCIVVPGVSLGMELPFDVLRARCGGYVNKTWLKFKIVTTGLLRFNVLRRRLYDVTRAHIFLRREFQRRGFTAAKVEFIDHHTCHAASAFFSSPFETALVFTQDGKGDGTSGTVFQGQGNRLREVSRQRAIDSIGQIYAEVTRYLGFRPNRHEGKVTGLAAFGDPNSFLRNFHALVDEIDVVVYRSRALEGFSGWHGGGFKSKLAILASHPEVLPYAVNAAKLQLWLEKNCSRASREDIAAAVQRAVEDWVVKWVAYNVSSSGGAQPVNVCLAGGLFANVKINQRVREGVPGVANLYVQPAMGDSGLALGAAQLYWHRNGPAHARMYHLTHAYLGPRYGVQAIESALRDFGEGIIWRKVSRIEEEIGRLLNDGAIVGRFSGRTEWGPRALGNRSILIRPTQKGINDTVNKRLRRNEFMPFAPSVLDYRARDYFVGYNDSHIAAEFMTTTYNVHPEVVKQIEAVVHVDNTARPQIVRERTNPSFYKLLQAYEKNSGIGCVVNTSFNLHEEPIVNSPQDALRALLEGAVDVLALESYLVFKKSLI
jgi:carbamoyltransferase